MIPTYLSRIGKSVESRLEVNAGVGGMMEWRYGLMGTEFLFGVIKYFGERTAMIAQLTMNVYSRPMNCILRIGQNDKFYVRYISQHLKVFCVCPYNLLYKYH